MSTQQAYQLKSSDEVLELTIPAMRSTTWQLALLVQVGLFTILILVTILIMINEPVEPFGLVLMIGGIALFAYLGYGAIATYVWVRKGFEYLRIDKKNHTFLYQKQGLTIDDQITCSLDQLDGWAICPELNDYIDVHPRYGTMGGAICFWVAKKRYRMGIALSEAEAQICIATLEAFLKK